MRSSKNPSQGLSGREIAKVVCVSEAAVRRILTTSREVPKTGGDAVRPCCLKSLVDGQKTPRRAVAVLRWRRGR